MYKITAKEFELYNGEKLTYAYREDTNDLNTILSVVHDDEYKTSKMTYKKGDTFIDIGAHIGSWAKLMQHLVDDANIICVEPIPENIGILKANTNYTAKILMKAISGQSNQTVKINYGDNTEGGKHHKFIGEVVGFAGEEYIEVPTISLNDLLKDVDHVRVMKLDCEGAEHEAFEGASVETLKKIDYLIGEYHNPEKLASQTRTALFTSTKGVFNDITPNKNSELLGLFHFRNKRLHD